MHTTTDPDLTALAQAVNVLDPPDVTWAENLAFGVVATPVLYACLVAFLLL